MEENQVTQVTQKWSILLLYPYQYDNDTETYLAWIEAPTAVEAIVAAKNEMIEKNGWNEPEVVECDGPFDKDLIEVILVVNSFIEPYVWRAEG